MISTPYVSDLWALSIASLCCVENCGTSAFPWTIPPKCGAPDSCPYVPSEMPLDVSTLRRRLDIVHPIDFITLSETAYFVAYIDVISGYILSKCEVISCCRDPIVHFCILALSNVRSLSIIASGAERCGRNPCCSSQVSVFSKLFLACFPIKNLRQELNSAGTFPMIHNVCICRTPGFFSSIKSTIVVQ